MFVNSWSAGQIQHVLWLLLQLRATVPEPLVDRALTVLQPQLASLTPVQLASLMRTFSRLDCSLHHGFMADWDELTSSSLGSLTAAQLTGLAHSLASIGYRPSKTWLLTFERATLEVLNSITFEQHAKLMHSLAVFRYQPSLAWQQECFNSCQAGVPSANVQPLVELTMAVATARLLPPSQWCSAATERLLQVLPQMSADALPLLVWAMARIGCQPDHIGLKLLASQLTQPCTSDTYSQDMHAATGTPLQTVPCKAMGLCLWGLATMACRQPDGRSALRASYITAVEEQMQERLQHYDAAALSNIAWAFARFEHTPAATWQDRYRSASLHLMDRFTAQGLACMIWGMAMMGVKLGRSWRASFYTASGTYLHQASCKSSSDESSSCIGDGFTASALSQVAWSLTSLGLRPDVEWQSSWCGAVVCQLPNMTSTSLCNVVWALAHWQPIHKRAVQSKDSNVAGICQPVRDTSSTAHSAEAAPAPAQLMQSLKAQMLWRLESFSATQLSTALWSLSVLGERASTAWLDAVYDAVLHLRHSLQPSEVADVLWALCKQEHMLSAARMTALLQVQAQQLTTGCRPDVLIRTLDCLDHLDHEPDDAWVQQALQVSYAAVLQQRQMQQAPACDDYGAAGGTRVTPPQHRGMQSASLWLPHHVVKLWFQLACLAVSLPHVWCARFQVMTHSLLHRLSSKELACLLWSVATLRWTPSTLYLHSVLVHIKRLVQQLQPSDLALCGVALAMLGVTPSKQWRNAFAARAISVKFTREQREDMQFAMQFLMRHDAGWSEQHRQVSGGKEQSNKRSRKSATARHCK